MNRLTTLLLLLLSALLASPASAQWESDRPLVLRGRVVSMVPGKRILRKQVVIRDGKIEAILRPSARIPADALVVETEGYIYPGLINLHDHLEYDFLPLYDVPKHSEHHRDWPRGKDYAKNVGGPWKVVTSPLFFDRSDEAHKLAEVRALAGGVTTTQGGRLSDATSDWLVRNVEYSNFGEDLVDSKTFPIDARWWKERAIKTPEIKANRAWLLHLAEGTSDKARQQWSNPAFDPLLPVRTANMPGIVEAGLVFEGLVGVHCTAMTEDDFAQWKALTGQVKLVWSPTSNLMLYGQTTDVAAADRQGALIALGTDWSPTGTKNLLWELKAADRANRARFGRRFKDKELVAMITSNPAKLAGWEDKVGQIREGMVADLLVVDNVRPNRDSGYRNLLHATEPNVQLVLIDGEPLYGDLDHMQDLRTYAGEPHYELVPETVGARPKAIHLSKPEVPKGEQTLEEIRRSLEEALEVDPAELAEVVNNNTKLAPPYYEADPVLPLDYMKAELKKLLTRAGEPVPPELEFPLTLLTADHVADFLRLKYPDLEPGGDVEGIYTDHAFLDRLEMNLHWLAPYEAGIDLRRYLPLLPDPADASGITAHLGQ